MLFTVILSLVILSCVLLVLVILAQNSKGGGLSSQFGGSGASNMIGVKKTGDLLENLTWGLIVTVFVLVVSSSFLIGNTAETTDVLRERANEQNIAPPALNLEGLDGTDADGTTDLSNELSGDSLN
ncbi:preprotein translocase subunit SecG [Fulvivirga sedimenti]|uniref:Protein-export membrane protein SecG n=1 Tax=Fulvivirga sedimenti TaxID=2879465 RepID=A0A9X1KVW7_9BACT|nr:preprotein translocase subunit SecG [Fulvivirga sedimenti]MCA6073354.1 preprotein translocase subunit SecG [Fulvivirga sedimenti]